jgi:hypothetical protein
VSIFGGLDRLWHSRFRVYVQPTFVIIGRIQPGWKRRALYQSMNGRAPPNESIRAAPEAARKATERRPHRSEGGDGGNRIQGAFLSGTDHSSAPFTPYDPSVLSFTPRQLRTSPLFPSSPLPSHFSLLTSHFSLPPRCYCRARSTTGALAGSFLAAMHP